MSTAKTIKKPELKGHEVVERFLVGAMERNSLNHAYLLLGPQGVGKTTLVSAFLSRLMCETGTGCGACLGCRQVAEAGHPDVWWVRRAEDKQDITIEQVRELQEFAVLGSLAGGWRAVVVEGAHQLNAESGNALLKVLEEPPERVVFFLISDQPKRLLPTVRSRCFVLQLGLVPQPALVELLRSVGAPAADAAELAQFAGGRPGLALNLWRDPEAWQRAQEQAKLYLGLSGGSGFVAFGRYLEGEFKETATAERGARERALELTATWRTIARDVLCLKLGLPEYVRYGALASQAERLATQPVMKLVAQLKLVEEASRRLSANAHVRLTLEWLAYSLPLAV